MPGLDKILRGILKYRATMQPALMKKYAGFKGEPSPNALMFSCMDSRLMLTRFIQADVGDFFLVRNAGNIIPHGDTVCLDAVSTEPGALELACVINEVRQVVVCGHSDCKAMNALFNMKDAIRDAKGGTPLQMWLKKHGAGTVDKYHAWKAEGGQGPLSFTGETSSKFFTAYIDPENRFCETDKFSQINTLQQVQNIASHEILRELLEKDLVRINAFWFDLTDGDFYMFSREKQTFVKVTDEDYDHLLSDGGGRSATEGGAE